MKKDTISVFFIVLLLITGCGTKNDAQEIPKNISADPLPSWNQGELKKAIITYVNNITDSNSKDFIPEAERLATFDNDGTLWAERPYVQELFAFYRVKQMVEKNPALAKKQPFKAVIEHDKTYFEKGGDKAVIELMIATHTGLSEQEFNAASTHFYSSVKYPGLDVPIRQIVYKPQVELLNYLRANGFKIYICSGGTVEFIRCISKECYNIPAEQVIGTSFQYEFIDSSRSIFRKPALASFNDKAGKPANIQLHIGRPPVFACGNEGGEGDIAMLKFCQASAYPSFQMIINHDDSTREFFYQEKTNASLKAASQNNWHVVSMKKDWKEIFTR